MQGLSVNLRAMRSVKQTQADWKSCHMIAVLTVGSVRAVDAAPKLDVIQTTADRDYLSRTERPLNLFMGM